MALQWVMLSCLVASEALIALVLTLPWPAPLKSRIVGFVSHLLQPTLGIVPFAIFQLLDVYWKTENRLMCTIEPCTTVERDRFERAVYKSQRNTILGLSACLLYWIVYRICKYYTEIEKLEDEIKRRKDA